MIAGFGPKLFTTFNRDDIPVNHFLFTFNITDPIPRVTFSTTRHALTGCRAGHSPKGGHGSIAWPSAKLAANKPTGNTSQNSTANPFVVFTDLLA